MRHQPLSRSASDGGRFPSAPLILAKYADAFGGQRLAMAN